MKRRVVEQVVISCGWCGSNIPQEKIKKSGTIHPPKYCSRSHANKARGRAFYEKLSRAGNATQAEIQAQTGRKPGYEKRSAAMSKSNHLNPRRKKRLTAINDGATIPPSD